MRSDERLRDDRAFNYETPHYYPCLSSFPGPNGLHDANHGIKLLVSNVTLNLYWNLYNLFSVVPGSRYGVCPKAVWVSTTG